MARHRAISLAGHGAEGRGRRATDRCAGSFVTEQGAAGYVLGALYRAPGFQARSHYIVVAALKALADEGKLPLAKAAEAAEAIRKYGIDADKTNPLNA